MDSSGQVSLACVEKQLRVKQHINKNGEKTLKVLVELNVHHYIKQFKFDR